MASFRDIASTPGDADVLQTSLEELHRRRHAKLLEERERQSREQSRLFGEDGDGWSTAQELAYRRDVLKTWAAAYPKLREAVVALAAASSTPPSTNTSAVTTTSPSSARPAATAPVFSVADTVRAAYPPVWIIPAGTVPPSFYADASAAAAMEVVSGALASRTLAAAATGNAPSSSSTAFVVTDYSGEPCRVRVRREALQPAGATATTTSSGSHSSSSAVMKSFAAALPQRVLARWPDGKPASAKANAVLRSIDIEERKREQWNAHVRRQQQQQQHQPRDGTTTKESAHASSTRGGSNRRYDAISSINPHPSHDMDEGRSSSSSTNSYSVDSSIHLLEGASAPATAGQGQPQRSRSSRVTEKHETSKHVAGGSGHRHGTAAVRGCSVEAGDEDASTAGHALYWPAYITRTRALFTGAACLQDTFHGLGRLQRHERFEPVLALALVSPVRIVVDVVYAIDETTEALGLSIDPAVSHDDSTPASGSAAAASAAVDGQRGRSSGSSNAVKKDDGDAAPRRGRPAASSGGALSPVSSALAESDLPLLLPTSLPPVLSDLNAGFTVGPATSAAAAAHASTSALSVSGKGGSSSAAAGAARSRTAAAASRWSSTLAGDNSGAGASTMLKGGTATAVLRRSALATSPSSAYGLLAGPVSQTHSMVLLRPTPEVVCAARAQALQELEERWRRLRQALINRLLAYEEEAPHAVASSWTAPATAAAAAADAAVEVSSIPFSRSTSSTSRSSLPSDVLACTSLPPTFIEPASPPPSSPRDCPSARSPSPHLLSVQLPDADTYESPFLDRSARRAARLPAQPAEPVELTQAEMQRQTRVPQLQGGRLPRRPLTYQVEEAPSASVSVTGRLRLSNTSLRSAPLEAGLPDAWEPQPKAPAQQQQQQHHASRGVTGVPASAPASAASYRADVLPHHQPRRPSARDAAVSAHTPRSARSLPDGARSPLEEGGEGLEGSRADTAAFSHGGDGPRRWSAATAHFDSSAAPLEESRRLSAAVRAAAVRRRAVEDAVRAQQRRVTAPRATLPTLPIAAPSPAALGASATTTSAITTAAMATTALSSPPSALWKAEETATNRSRVVEAAAAAAGDGEASPMAHTPPPPRLRQRAADASPLTSQGSAINVPRDGRSTSLLERRDCEDDAVDESSTRRTTSGMERYSAIFASSARSVPESPPVSALQEASLTAHFSWEAGAAAAPAAAAAVAAASHPRSLADRQRDPQPQQQEVVSGKDRDGPASLPSSSAAAARLLSPATAATTSTPSRRPLPARGRQADVVAAAPLSTPSSDPPLSLHVSASGGGGGGISASSFAALTPITVHASAFAAGTPPPPPPSHAASPFARPPATPPEEVRGMRSSPSSSSSPPQPQQQPHVLDVSHSTASSGRAPVGRLQLLTPLQSPLATPTHALLAMVEPPSSSRISTLESASQRSATQPPQPTTGASSAAAGATATPTPANSSHTGGGRDAHHEAHAQHSPTPLSRRPPAGAAAADARRCDAAQPVTEPAPHHRHDAPRRASAAAAAGTSHSSLSSTAGSVEMPALRSTAAYAATGSADPLAGAVAVKSAAPRRAAKPAAATALSPQPSPRSGEAAADAATSRSSSTPSPSSRSHSLRDQRQLQLRNLERHHPQPQPQPQPQHSSASATTSLRDTHLQPPVAAAPSPVRPVPAIAAADAALHARPAPTHAMPPSPRSLAHSAALAAAAAAAAAALAPSHGSGPHRGADSSPSPLWDGEDARVHDADANVVVEVESGHDAAPSPARTGPHPKHRSAPVLVVEVDSVAQPAAARAERDARTHGSPLHDDSTCSGDGASAGRPRSGRRQSSSSGGRSRSQHHHHHRHGHRHRSRSSEAAAAVADSPLPRRPQHEQPQQQPAADSNAARAQQSVPTAHPAALTPRSPASAPQTPTVGKVAARDGADRTAPPKRTQQQPQPDQEPHLPARYSSLSLAVSDAALSASVNREVELPGQSARLPGVLSLRSSPTITVQMQQQRQQQPRGQRGSPLDLGSAYASSIAAPVEAGAASPKPERVGDESGTEREKESSDVAAGGDDDDSDDDYDAYSNAEARAETRRRSTHINPSRRASRTRRAEDGASSTPTSAASLPLPPPLPKRPPSSSASPHPRRTGVSSASAASSEDDDDEDSADAVALPAPPRGRPTAAPAVSTISSVSSWGLSPRERALAARTEHSLSPEVDDHLDGSDRAAARRLASPSAPLHLQQQPQRRRSPAYPDGRAPAVHAHARRSSRHHAHSARRGGEKVYDSDDNERDDDVSVDVEDCDHGVVRSPSPTSSSARSHTVLVRRVVRRRRSEVFVEEGGTLVYRAPMSAASTPRRITGDHAAPSTMRRQRSIAGPSSSTASMPHAQLQLTMPTPSASSSFVQQRSGH